MKLSEITIHLILSLRVEKVARINNYRDYEILTDNLSPFHDLI